MNVINWEFLDEPLYKWFIFLGAMLLFMMAWGAILGYIKRG